LDGGGLTRSLAQIGLRLIVRLTDGGIERMDVIGPETKRKVEQALKGIYYYAEGHFIPKVMYPRPQPRFAHDFSSKSYLSAACEMIVLYQAPEPSSPNTLRRKHRKEYSQQASKRRI